MESGKAEFKLFSGVVAYVTPLSLDTMRLVADKVNEVDAGWEKEFEKPLRSDSGEQIAIDEDQTFIDVKDPRYRPRYEEVSARRLQFQRALLADICIEFEESETELIERFAPRIEKMRKHLDLPGDKWQATLHHAIIVLAQEWTDITQVIFNKTPIQEAEIRDQMRIFRPVVSRSQLLGINRDSPGIHRESNKSAG